MPVIIGALTQLPWWQSPTPLSSPSRAEGLAARGTRRPACGRGARRKDGGKRGQLTRKKTRQKRSSNGAGEFGGQTW